ncbi:MAG TPA: hypothetical protein VGL53_08925 [Bryobacteraceae bacterium]|jgi:hypothetical protein
MKRLVVLLLIVSAAASAEVTLSEPGRTLAVPQWNDGKLMPIWSHGFLFSLGAEDGSVTVYSTTGEQSVVVADTKIWPGGTAAPHLAYASASPDGTVFAVCGTTLRANGNVDGFIYFFGPGRSPHMVQLPYTGPMRVAFADDGTLWVLLREFYLSTNELEKYDMLRHFDVNGKFLGSAIPNYTLPPSAKYSAIYTPSLSISHDTIAVYFDRPHTWIELAYDGTVKGQWQVPETSLGTGQPAAMTRLELTSSNQVVRVTGLVGKGHGTRVELLERSSGTLDAATVDFSSMARVHPYLIGIDNEQLVWLGDSSMLDWCSLVTTHTANTALQTGLRPLPASDRK